MTKKTLKDWIFYTFSTSFILLIFAFVFGGFYYFNIDNIFYYWSYNIFIAIAALSYFIAGLLLTIYGSILGFKKLKRV